MTTFSPTTTTKIKYHHGRVFLYFFLNVCRVSLHVLYIFSLHKEEEIKKMNVCTSMPPDNENENVKQTLYRAQTHKDNSV